MLRARWRLAVPALGEVSSSSVLLTEVQAVVVLVLGAGAAVG